MSTEAQTKKETEMSTEWPSLAIDYLAFRKAANEQEKGLIDPRDLLTRAQQIKNQLKRDVFEEKRNEFFKGEN